VPAPNHKGGERQAGPPPGARGDRPAPHRQGMRGRWATRPPRSAHRPALATRPGRRAGPPPARPEGPPPPPGSAREAPPARGPPARAEPPPPPSPPGPSNRPRRGVPAAAPHPSVSRLGPHFHPPEPPGAMPVGLQGFVQVPFGEIGPEHGGGPELRVGHLPQEEVADAKLSARSDDQIGIGKARGVQVLREQGL